MQIQKLIRSTWRANICVQKVNMFTLDSIRKNELLYQMSEIDYSVTDDSNVKIVLA